MERQPTAAFVLTLLAGLWMLATGGMMYGMGAGFTDGGQYGMWGPGMMHGIMWTVGPGYWFPWLGLVAGVGLLIASVFLYNKPEQSRTWGLVILIVSAVSAFVGMGGILAGSLGVVGEALAMTWTPSR